MNNLSDIEVHFLHEFEEFYEELYQLKIDLQYHFNLDPQKNNLQNIVKDSIKALFTKNMIQPVMVTYKKIGDNEYEVDNEINLDNSYVDKILNDPRNWNSDYIFNQQTRYYFQITEEGINELDKISVRDKKRVSLQSYTERGFDEK